MKFLFLFSMLACALLRADPAAVWDKEMMPILENYCFDCHADGSKKGDFSFENFPTIASMQANRSIWKRVRENLTMELMPPIDKDQPSRDERKKLVAWIDAAVFPIDPKNPDPGRVTLRRLNTFEYQNTVRDLVGVTPDTSLLPPDDGGYGFDNIADVLSLSPAHVEAYLTTAANTLDEVYGKTSPPSKDIPPNTLSGSPAFDGEEFSMYTGGTRSIALREKPGKYKVTFRLGGEQAGDEPVKAVITLGKEKKAIEIPKRTPEKFSITTDLGPDANLLAIEFTNDFWDEKTKGDRNLIIHGITLEGPLDGGPKRAAVLFPPRKEKMTDDQYAALVLSNFLSHAFRRPATEDEIARHYAFVKKNRKPGQSLEDAMRPAFEAALISPQFLFRELHAVYSLEKPGAVVPVPELALAARMSYFLWSSTPDDTTLAQAAAGQLRQNFTEEMNRLIRDPKSSALIDRFFGQWLQYQDAAFIPVDTKLYPAVNDQLRKAMVKETRTFCEDLWKNNLPITRLIDADYTYVNERLARHYKISNVSGDDFRKVPLQDPQRRGILTQGSILVLTSNPNRTSPVKRGKWVLETLLDQAPPPPPPNVPSLAPPSHSSTARSMREQLEAHRKDAACASCHKLMDGIGFSFEAFDVDGSRRPAGFDSQGVLSTGERVDSPAALAKIIAEQRAGVFHRAFAAKLLTFALGRGLDYYDQPAIDKIVASAAKENHTLHAYLRATMVSFPFQYYRK